MVLLVAEDRRVNGRHGKPCSNGELYCNQQNQLRSRAHLDGQLRVHGTDRYQIEGRSKAMIFADLVVGNAYRQLERAGRCSVSRTPDP